MALKKIIFPAIYEPSPRRSEAEVLAALDRRFDSPAREPRTEASTPLAPPPPDGRYPPAKASIGKIVRKPKKATGRPAANPLPSCRSHTWLIIGKSRTPGKVRVRCTGCKRERTVPEADAPARIYRKGEK